MILNNISLYTNPNINENIKQHNTHIHMHLGTLESAEV